MPYLQYSSLTQKKDGSSCIAVWNVGKGYCRDPSGRIEVFLLASTGSTLLDHELQAHPRENVLQKEMEENATKKKVRLSDRLTINM